MFENVPFAKCTVLCYSFTSFAAMYYSPSLISANFFVRILLLINTSTAVEPLLGTARLSSISLVTTAISSIFTKSPFISLSTTLVLLFNSLVPSTKRYQIFGILPVDNKTIVNIIFLHILLTSPSGTVFKSLLAAAVTFGYFAIPPLRDFRLPSIINRMLDALNTSDHSRNDLVQNETPRYLEYLIIIRHAEVQQRVPSPEIQVTEDNISALLDLGFTRDQSVEALSVSNNDPNRAASYLMG